MSAEVVGDFWTCAECGAADANVGAWREGAHVHSSRYYCITALKLKLTTQAAELERVKAGVRDIAKITEVWSQDHAINLILDRMKYSASLPPVALRVDAAAVERVKKTVNGWLQAQFLFAACDRGFQCNDAVAQSILTAAFPPAEPKG